MNTNVLVALKNLMTIETNELLDIYQGNTHNRANNMGDALEYFLKDLFCSSLNEKDFSKRDEIYSSYLSYLGNSNNPPDFIIKQSSAVEVKKIEKLSFGDIALNSSSPKDLLHSDSTLINEACKKCENEFGGWISKEMIYAIGNIIENKLRVLWLLDGECYAANESVYKRIKTTIKKGVNNIQGVEFTESNELGKVKKIDPLGVTDLRVRGMWSIKHPMKVFDYLVTGYSKNTNLQVYCLFLKSKIDKICEDDKHNIKEYINNGKLVMRNVKVKNPNNPAKYLDAILFEASL